MSVSAPVLTLIVLPMLASAAFDWMSRPGTVTHALSQSDGTHVYLDAVQVGKIRRDQNPQYFVVRESYSQKDRIIVYAAPPELLRFGQTIDVEGTVTTLEHGKRAIADARIVAYTDRDGNILYNGPLIKGPLEPTPWEWKVDLTTAGGMQGSSSAQSLESVPPLPGEPSPTPESVAGPSDQISTVASQINYTFITLKCMHVQSTGAGYFIMGDNYGSTIQVYYTGAVDPTRRIVSMSATVYTGVTPTVLCVESGPAGYTPGDHPTGYLTTAPLGTVAYASTLPDSTQQAPQWVYLTGRIMTANGSYRPYNDLSNPVGVFYVQGFDRSAGIRVLRSSTEYIPPAIVDVMAEVTTQDGERMLGIPGNPSSAETVGFANNYWMIHNSAYPRLMFLNHRALGGNEMGYNPGVSTSYGLYNIGSYVKVFGKVVGKGTYYDGGYGTVEEYIQVDDGSGVPCDKTYLEGLKPGNVASATGVMVFGSVWDLNVDDYATVTGVSSVWAPQGSGGTRYASIRMPAITEVDPNASGGGITPVMTFGTINVDTKVYGAPNQPVTVRYYASDGRITSRTLTCGSNGVGSDSFDWSGFVKTIDRYGYPEDQTHTISAMCDGFKTRTYPNISPGDPSPNPVNIRLVPLRKIYFETNTHEISPCDGSNTATLTATVRDHKHDPVPNLQVKFWTDAGSLDNEYPIQHTAIKTTDSSGQVQMTFYGVPEEAGRECHVKATDDLQTPLPTESDDAYNHDWEPLPSSGYHYNSIAVSGYTASITLTPAHMKMKQCEDLPLTAAVSSTCGPVETDVTFTTDSNKAFFVENGQSDYTTRSSLAGIATATLRAKDPKQFGSIWVSASATVHGRTLSDGKSVELVQYSPEVTVDPVEQTIHGPATCPVTFIVKDIEGNAINQFPIRIGSSAGTIQGHNNPEDFLTGSDGRVTVSIQLNPAQSAVVTGTFNDDCLGQRTKSGKIRYAVAPWISGVGTSYSSPLVADLVPGGPQEVALIAKKSTNYSPDGVIYVWGSDGGELWGRNTTPQAPQIDTAGNNTLSTADIDDRGGLEISAPANPEKSIYVFGYNAGFKPLAGWPQASDYPFYRAAAALGDSNLDGTTKVIAADESCFVFDWNAGGRLLWLQVTGSSGVTIDNSSVALGQINTATNANRPPEAVVGAETDPGLWGFEGNEWHNYSGATPPYHYTTRWTNPVGIGMGNMQSSPAIGRIDSDDINDIAVGDNAGKLWVWLSSDSTWHAYQTGSAIQSSPAVVDLEGAHTIVFGSDNGRVYKVFWNGTTGALEDSPGWASGILLAEGYSVKASPVVGDVMNTSSLNNPDPQIVVANTDGNVYALWKDGTNHPGGPVAKVWTCSQTDAEVIYATPSICSLDGSNLSLIVASTENVYKLDLYSTTAFGTDPARWPWPTFHHDPARTGCSWPASTTMVSGSVIGRVKDSSGAWIIGAKVTLDYSTDNVHWYSAPVYGRPTEPRGIVYTTGDASRQPDQELNRGGFVINQLEAGRMYRLKVTVGTTTKNYSVNGGAPISAQRYTQPDITW